MPYIGNNHIAGDHTNNFKVLDDISSFTATFDGSATSVVDTTNDTIRVVEHRFIQGQRVTYTNGSGGNIGGLTTGTAYFVIFDSASSIKLATSASNAASSTAINLSAVGTGSSHTLNVAFDGVNTKFKLTHGSGTGARLNNATQVNVAINNVVQRPNLDPNNFTDGFALEDNHKIVFQTAPTSEDIFWGSIIANTLTTFDISDHKIDTFTGDGSTTEFTLSHTPANNESLMVTINGVLQHPSNASTARAYTLIASIIQFTAAPGVGDEIQVRHIGFAGATTADVSGFYGRTGNVVLTDQDDITVNKINVGTGVTIESNGQATFVGVVTFGSGSTTIDNNVVNVGTALTLGHTQGLQFHTQNLHSDGFEINNINASGIITASQFVGNIGGNPTFSGDTTFNGSVSIGGTLTYEDVTNIDSIGIVTARDGIDCNGDLDVDGHTNLDNVSIAGVATVTGSNINIEGGSAALTQLKINSTGRFRGVQLDENGTRKAHFQHDATDNKTIVGTAEGTLQFNSGDTGRIILNSSGHWVPVLDSTYDLGLTGTRWRNVYADTFVGNANIGIITATSIDLNGDLDVDGHTNLDNVSIAGVTTMGQTTIAHTSAPQLIIKDSDTTGAADSNGISFQDASNTQYGFIGQTSSGGHTMLITTTNTVNPIRLQVNSSTKLEVGHTGTYVQNGNFYVLGGYSSNISGDVNLNSNEPTVNFNDSNANPDYKVFVNTGVFKITDTTNNVDRITIASAGQVGINSTAPSNKLDVVGDADVLGLYRSDYTGSGGAGLNLHFGRAKADGSLFNAAKITAVGSDNTGTNGELRFSVLDGGSLDEKLRIDSNGNITAVDSTAGATTGVTLKVGANASTGTNSGTIIINNGGQGNASLQFDYENSAARAKIYTYSSTNDIIFDTSGTEAFRIFDGGNIRQQKSSANPNFTLSRNASIGNDNQVIGTIDFASNTAHTVQARLMGKNHGTNNVGGYLVFETRVENGSLTEKFRLNGDGQTLLTRGTVGGQESIGNVNNTWWKIGTWAGPGVDAAARATITVLGANTHNSGNPAGGETKIYLSITGSAVYASFYSHTDHHQGVIGVAHKYDSSASSCEIWVKYSSGYSSTSSFADVTNGYFTGASVNTGSSSTPSGATLATAKYVVRTSNGTTSSERLLIDASGRIGMSNDSSSMPDPSTSHANADELTLGAATGSVRAGMTINSGANLDGSIHFGDPDSNVSGQINYDHNGDHMRLYTASNVRLDLSSSGAIVKNASGNMMDLRTTASTGSCWLQLSDNSGNQKGYFGFGSGSNETLYIVQQESANISIYTGSSIKWNFTTGGSFEPGANDAYDIGSTSNVVRNIFTGDLHLNNLSKEKGNDVDGTNGSWTIQEGQDDLYIINKLNGKKYRIPLEEVN